MKDSLYATLETDSLILKQVLFAHFISLTGYIATCTRDKDVISRLTGFHLVRLLQHPFMIVCNSLNIILRAIKTAEVLLLF